MNDDGERDAATDRFAYSRAALARLVLSAELRDLADRAAAGVPAGSDSWSRLGEKVGAARTLVSMAEEVLARAVIYERARGATWETIADELDMKRQSAHERFRDAEREWQESLHEPFYPAPPEWGVRNLRLHEAAYEPTATGRRLDAWAEQRGQGEHAVTGGLPTLTTTEELGQVLDAIFRQLSTATATADERADLLEAKAALLERVATEEGRPDVAEMAAEARARATELRAETQP